jgi:hypothetical protein
MLSSDLRFLFAYDCWATTNVPDAADGMAGVTSSTPNAIGQRGRVGIVVPTAAGQSPGPLVLVPCAGALARAST